MNSHPSTVLPDAVIRLATARSQERFLDPHHLEAAAWLTRLCERARLRQRVTMSYDQTRIGTGGRGSAQSDIADTAADARRRLADVARGLPADCWDVLFDICGLELGLQDVEARRGWPRRSAKLVLRIGLEQVAQMRGLSATAEGAARMRSETWLPERPPMFPAAGS